MKGIGIEQWRFEMNIKEELILETTEAFLDTHPELEECDIEWLGGGWTNVGVQTIYHLDVKVDEVQYKISVERI